MLIYIDSFKEIVERERERERLTLLGIEEEESFVEGESVIVWRGWRGLVLGQVFGNDNGKSNYKESNHKRPYGIFQGLVATHYASKIHIFLLLLPLIRTQQPALLGFIKKTMLLLLLLLKLLPFHVSAPLVFCA